MIEVIMDQSGKVEIPEVIRRCLGLNPGSKLQIAMAWQEEIRLRPLPDSGEITNHPASQPASQQANHEESASEAESAELIWKNGVLMVKAMPVDEETQYAIDHAVELDREARLKEIMGNIGQ
jgi:bifunctional DNA-binding transcriptional regulator/antitoxin component of YhaV-PrlF toxin-antitoxin module